MRTKLRDELVERWRDFPDSLNVVRARSSGTPNSRTDLRGLPFTTENFRNNIRSIDIDWADFSYANFHKCNFFDANFSNCVFVGSIFTEIRQWNCRYSDCNFEKADFTNATLGVGTLFEKCTFVGCKLKGKYFDFGSQNVFRECRFLDCKIQSAWIISVRFERCIFRSKFLNVRFSGSVEASVRASEGEYPATLINCDLSKSEFKGVEIMDGAVMSGSVLPDQESERFNNDRIFYE